MKNSAAMGYMIIAAKYLKLETELIKKLEAGMRTEMDMTTEEEAEQAYYNN